MDYHLRLWGDQVLRERCAEVEDFSRDSGLETLLTAMHGVMEKRDFLGRRAAVGIAAPQVGETKRVMLADVDYRTQEFINPRITARSGHRLSLEGCLSIPLLLLPKLRNSRIEMEYQDRHGSPHAGTFTGHDAVVLQHEFDHLDGRLIVDYF